MKQLVKYLFLVFVLMGQAQNPVIDSLKLVFKNAKHDTTRCNALNAMIEAEVRDMVWEKYNNQLKEIVERNLAHLQKNTKEYRYYRNLLSDVYNNQGLLFYNQSNNEESMNFYRKSYEICNELGDKEGVATALFNMAVTYNGLGDLKQALELFTTSMNMCEERGDSLSASYCWDNLAAIHASQKEYQAALDFYSKGLNLRLRLGVKERIASSYNNIGTLYYEKGEYLRALDNYGKSLKINREIDNKQGIANTLNNAGFVYHNLGRYSEALVVFEEGAKLFTELNENVGMSIALNGMGAGYFKQYNFQKALYYSLKAKELALEAGFPDYIKGPALNLSRIYKATGNYKSAYENYQLFIQMRDSVNNEENKKASIKNQLKYEYEKKAAADSVRVAEEKKVVAAQLQQEKTQRFALYGGLGLVGLFAIFMVNRFRVTTRQKKLIEEQKKAVEDQKHLVEEKQKEILDSIHYAKRIQTALVTSDWYIERALNRLNK